MSEKMQPTEKQTLTANAMVGIPDLIYGADASSHPNGRGVLAAAQDHRAVSSQCSRDQPPIIASAKQLFPACTPYNVRFFKAFFLKISTELP